jgi:hypothetical protein
LLALVIWGLRQDDLLVVVALDGVNEAVHQLPFLVAAGATTNLNARPDVATLGLHSSSFEVSLGPRQPLLDHLVLLKVHVDQGVHHQAVLVADCDHAIGDAVDKPVP